MPEHCFFCRCETTLATFGNGTEKSTCVDNWPVRVGGERAWDEGRVVEKAELRTPPRSLRVRYRLVGRLLQEARVVGIHAFRAELVADRAGAVEELVEDKPAEILASRAGVAAVHLQRSRAVGRDPALADVE